MAAISYGTTGLIGTVTSWDCGTAATTTSSGWISSTASTSAAYYSPHKYTYTLTKEMLDDYIKKIPAGKREIELPDGAKLLVDDLGNYRIEDKNAKVTYQANRIREFSPHLNASDMLAKFVGYVGSLGVKRDEVLRLPLELFINWLVIEAAERDGDPVPSDVVPVPSHPLLKSCIRPKCLACGRFIRRLHVENRFPFCNPMHGEIYLARRLPRLEAPQSLAAQSL